ncbi:MAG TPA: DUF6089 family protein [Flavobacteriaceae bacterium]|nr:DUF6089 family protein [Flavobacteriaceae bacterium]
MRYFAVALLVFTVFSLKGQTYEIGIMAGGANYIGDIGPTNYIRPNNIAVGGIAKWNRSPRHSFRLSALYLSVGSDDSKSSDGRRVERGYKFKNSIKELSLGLEYTFWEFDLYKTRSQGTPYLYTGITWFHYNDLYYDQYSKDFKSQSSTSDFAIPMVMGYKTTIGTNIILGVEIGARYTFTDNIDGSFPEGTPGNSTATPFGNINNNDWYVFTGITLTYTFGNKPCFCAF